MKIDVESTTWHGCRYYTVRPHIDFWHTVSDSGIWVDMESWCQQTFGEKGDPWSNCAERWYYNNSKIFLREETDLSLFLLRWQ
jgi:hypothetical protein